ncbi:MAG: VWA domain-containing protein [Pseudomonadota bacterium]
MFEPAEAGVEFGGACGAPATTTPAALQCYLAGFGCAGVEVGVLPATGVQTGAGTDSGDDDTSLRAVLSEAALLLPPSAFARAPSRQQDWHLHWLAAAAHAVAHLRHSPRHRPVGQRKPLMLAVLGLIEDARVERLLARDYPGLRTLWGRFHVASGGPRDLTFASLAARLARALHDPGYSDPSYWVNKGRMLFEARADRLDQHEAFLEVGAILASDMGQMRVRFDPEQYRVAPSYRDDNSMLWKFDQDRAAAPDEPLLARDALQGADAGSGDDAAPEVAPDTQARSYYPEWDYLAATLRHDWTCVIEAARGAQGTVEPAGTLATSFRLRLPSGRAGPERAARLWRQADGDELDLDAAIDSLATRTGRAPDPRVFMRNQRHGREHALLVLLDLSESSNDRVPGTFTSVLDLQKRAAAMLLQAAQQESGLRCRIALHGFASNGRHEVRYTRIKEFDEPFGSQQHARLMAQQGALSTRMGAALRHAGHCFMNEKAGNKSILVVTDGRPSDIDVDDERYLAEDVRQAVAGLGGEGVGVFCLTVDRKADAYARAMFGSGHYVIVEQVALLAQYLARACALLSSH